MSRPERRVVLRDVALQAGVSLGTASNVFAEKSSVSEEIRTAVLAAAADLGYRPRPRATRARSVPVSTMGMVMRHRMGSPLGNAFYSHVLHGAQTACAEYGITLTYEILPPPPDDGRVLPLIVQRRRVQGVLVVGHVNPAALALLRQAEAPFVLVDDAVDPPLADVVRGDDERGGYLAAKCLLDHGHRQPPPAIIAGPLDHASIRGRLAGYRRALAEADCAADDAYVRIGDLGPDRGRREMLALLDLPAPPTAVFCCNDTTAQGALNALHERGVDVPGGCSVVGYDDIDWAGHAVPPLTTVHVEKELLGAQAVWHLLERIERPGMPLRQTSLAVTLVDRRSVGPPAP